MAAQHTLAIALIALMGTVGLWDIWAISANHPTATVSNIIGTWSAAFPVLPFCIGLLAGHLFWPRDCPTP